MTYRDSLEQAMHGLGRQNDTIFIGQGMMDGTFMSSTLNSVPIDKKLEMPVIEQFQMQFSYGLALEGYTVISIFPRQNFLLLGLADLINVIDKLPILTEKKIKPNIIIRTAVGTTSPIYPGIQHSGEFHNEIKNMLSAVEVFVLKNKYDIFPIYKNAYKTKGTKIIIEFGDLYLK